MRIRYRRRGGEEGAQVATSGDYCTAEVGDGWGCIRLEGHDGPHQSGRDGTAAGRGAGGSGGGEHSCQVDDLKVEIGAVMQLRPGLLAVERTVHHHLIISEVPAPDGMMRFTVHVTHGTLIIEPNASNAVVLRVENLR